MHLRPKGLGLHLQTHQKPSTVVPFFAFPFAMQPFPPELKVTVCRASGFESPAKRPFVGGNHDSWVAGIPDVAELSTIHFETFVPLLLMFLCGAV